jgi:hypothetical protein
MRPRRATSSCCPSSQAFSAGENRYGFGVFTLEGEPVPDEEVALYVAEPNRPAAGPFPATMETMEPAAAFQSKATETDPDAAELVYHAEVDFASEGRYEVMALVRDDDGYGSVELPGAIPGQSPEIPDEGEKAPVIHTPTPEDVGGDLTRIDTRQPPSSMHENDFADVVGERPVVLLFATPALCTSRVCGPVVDIAEEVKSERGDEAEFILMEIYNDNQVDQGLRPQVEAYNLQSEPWLFVIDAEGRISTAIEGPFSKNELDAALDRVVD